MKKQFYIIAVIILISYGLVGCKIGDSKYVPATGEFELSVNSDGMSYYLVSYTGLDRFVTIPEKHNGYPVTAIGPSAFNNNQTLEGVLIPKAVVTIESYAFAATRNLLLVEFEKGSQLKYIDESAFGGCVNLERIDIPLGLESIGRSAFYNVRNLERIVIPASVTFIDESAFNDTRSLTIYAEAAKQPEGWNPNWNNSNRPVIWNHK